MTEVITDEQANHRALLNGSKFKMDYNEYAKGTRLLNEYEYKGYFIREFKQEPCEDWKRYVDQNDDDIETPDDEWYELGGHERGEGGFEILDSTGEVIEEDWYTMGEDSACSNAEFEVDYITKQGVLYDV